MAAKKNPRSKAAAAGKWNSRYATAIKWIGGVTAAMSLLAGLYQFVEFVGESRARERRVGELLLMAQNQQRSERFEQAWEHLAAATELDRDNDKLRRAYEDLAMLWLRAARITQGETFHTLAAKLEPILDRGLINAPPARQADLHAHLGWAAFLRWRERPSGASPADAYRQALALDPANPYAHAMLGHWLIWTDNDIVAAQKHFAAGAASGRAVDYVRSLQLAALDNARTPAAAIEMIAVANDMRKQNHEIGATERMRIWNVYAAAATRPDDGAGANIMRALPPAEHLATFSGLFAGRFDDERASMYAYWLAVLQAAAGHRADALQTLDALAAKLAGRQDLLATRTRSARVRIAASP